MTKRRLRLLSALFAIFALIAAACSDDGGSTTTTDEGTTTTAASVDDTVAPDDSGDPPDDGSEDPPDDGSEDPPDEVDDVAPFASAEGVTTDTIKFGVVTADLDNLRELGLVDINNGDVPDIWEVLVADMNANGGVAGRQLEMVYTEYNPVFSASAEDACVKLTQDEEVFIVLGGIAGPAIDSVLCFIEQNETAMIGGTHTPAHFPARKAPWVAIAMSSERRHQGTLALYQELGLLDGTVATYDDSSEHESVTEDVVLPALADLGVEVAESFTSTIPQGDEVALAEQASIYAEVAKDEGIETMIIIQSQLAFGIAHLRENGFTGTILSIDTGTMVNTIGSYDERPASLYDGVYSPMGSSRDEAWALPSAQACYDIYRAARPDVDVIHPADVPDGEPNWAGGLAGPCQALTIFKTAGDIAGGDLNYDTLQAAFDTLGDIDLAAVAFASIGPGKYDANDGLRIGIFDPDEGEEGSLVTVTDLTDVS